MSQSIFYSLSLPREQDGEAKVAELLLEAREVAATMGIQVGPLRVLSGEDCVHAQASMNDDFSFARSACRPPGDVRQAAIGTVPEKAIYFRIYEKEGSGLDIGLARYSKDAVLEILSESGANAIPYDGRWYHWTFYDAYTSKEVNVLQEVLRRARSSGHESTFKEESYA